MRAKAQAPLQLCLALICAVGAGFSGDLYAHHGSATHHAGRHARGTHARGTRSLSRTGQNDQATDLDVLCEDHSATAGVSGSTSNDGPAIVQALVVPVPEFVQLSVAEPVGPHHVRTAHSLARFGRAPPALL